MGAGGDQTHGSVSPGATGAEPARCRARPRPGARAHSRSRRGRAIARRGDRRDRHTRSGQGHGKESASRGLSPRGAPRAPRGAEPEGREGPAAAGGARPGTARPSPRRSPHAGPRRTGHTQGTRHHILSPSPTSARRKYGGCGGVPPSAPRGLTGRAFKRRPAGSGAGPVMESAADGPGQPRPSTGRPSWGLPFGRARRRSALSPSSRLLPAPRRTQVKAGAAGVAVRPARPLSPGKARPVCWLLILTS